jgi:hypothetical protein
MEKELHSLLWKIDSNEISYEARRNSQISIESGVGKPVLLLYMLCFHVLNSNLFLYVCLGDWFVNARQSFEFKRTGQGDYLKLSFQTPLTPMQTDTRMSHFQL